MRSVGRRIPNVTQGSVAATFLSITVFEATLDILSGWSALFHCFMDIVI